jgi:hypothetical protein
MYIFQHRDLSEIYNVVPLEIKTCIQQLHYFCANSELLGDVASIVALWPRV